MAIRKGAAKLAARTGQFRRRDRGASPPLRPVDAIAKAHRLLHREYSQAVAFSTVDQMAAQLDVNPSTIVRFTYRPRSQRLSDLQERMQPVRPAVAYRRPDQ